LNSPAVPLILGVIELSVRKIIVEMFFPSLVVFSFIGNINKKIGNGKLLPLLRRKLSAVC
jgi:hypothetical protein